MIANAAVKELLTSIKPGDEIIVAEQEDYFEGSPHTTNVKDIIKDNNKLVILI